MKRKYAKNAAFFCVVLILILTMLFSGLQLLESTVLFPGNEEAVQTGRKTITRNGIDYFPRQDITVVMVLGIDQYGPVVSSQFHRNEGAADSVMLLVFDETEKNCTVLYLNRDTMLDMDVLGLRGEYAGTAYGQLALAHTYGTGLADSCENVKNTLTKFLHGMTVDYYVSMHMDALPILNDAVGGVTVTVTDDFSKVNPTITMGELTLQGDQVVDFVRTRKDVGDQKNVTRMQRQEAYVNGFLQALLVKKQEGSDFAVRLYDQIAPYVVTNCSPTTLSSMLDRYNSFTLKEVLVPEGENRIEDGHYAFYADEEKLDALIVDLFYRAK